MDSDVVIAVNNLRDALCDEEANDCVAVRVAFTCEGISIEREYRSAEDLDRSGISMRNISGEFIKTNKRPSKSVGANE